jgi:hypothetical protein
MKILLLVYAVFLILTGIVGTLGVFYGRRYSLPNDKTKLGIVVYLVVIAAIVLVSFILISGTSWSGETA